MAASAAYIGVLANVWQMKRQNGDVANSERRQRNISWRVMLALSRNGDMAASASPRNLRWAL